MKKRIIIFSLLMTSLITCISCGTIMDDTKFMMSFTFFQQEKYVEAIDKLESIPVSYRYYQEADSISTLIKAKKYKEAKLKYEDTITKDKGLYEVYKKQGMHVSNKDSKSRIRTISGNYFATYTEEMLDHVNDLSIAKDYVSLQKLFDSGLITEIKKGTKVEVIKMKFTVVKFRIVGTNKEYWAAIEAVK